MKREKWKGEILLYEINRLRRDVSTLAHALQGYVKKKWTDGQVLACLGSVQHDNNGDLVNKEFLLGDLNEDKKTGEKERKKVYLLTDESGPYAFFVRAIYSSRERAEEKRNLLLAPYKFDASSYHKIHEIELNKIIDEVIGYIE